MDLSISNMSTVKIKAEPSSDDEEVDPFGKDVQTQPTNAEKESLEFVGDHGIQNQDSINSNAQIIKTEPTESEESATTNHVEIEVDILGYQENSMNQTYYYTGNKIASNYSPVQ